MASAGDESELGWFLREVRRALLHPREFASSIAGPGHGLGVVLVAIASGSAFALAVDLLVLASNGASALDAPGRLLSDLFFFGVRAAVVTALAAGAAIVVVRALRGRLDSGHAYAAASWPLVWWLPLPAIVALALIFEQPAVALAAIAATLAAALVAFFAYFFELPSVSRSRLLAAAVVAALIAGYGFHDRGFSAAVAYATIDPALVAPFEAAPVAGTRRERPGHAVTLPDEWRLSLTAEPGELARYVSPRDFLKITRRRGSELRTLAELADDVLRPEVLGAAMRVSERRFLRQSGRLLIEDVRAGVYEGVDVIVAVYTTRGGEGPVILTFRGNQRSDVARALEEWRGIAATLELPGDTR